MLFSHKSRPSTRKQIYQCLHLEFPASRTLVNKLPSLWHLFCHPEKTKILLCHLCLESCLTENIHQVFMKKNAYIRDKQINIITSCYLTQYWLFSYCLTFCILDALASELLLIHESALFQGEQISRHSKPHLRPPPSSILSICKCGLWTGTLEASWFIGNASLLGPLRIKGENELPWAYL